MSNDEKYCTVDIDAARDEIEAAAVRIFKKHLKKGKGNYHVCAGDTVRFEINIDVI